MDKNKDFESWERVWANYLFYVKENTTPKILPTNPVEEEVTLALKYYQQDLQKLKGFALHFKEQGDESNPLNLKIKKVLEEK